MPILHYVFCAMQLLFALAQYNDEDWAWWAPVYLLAGLWSFIAARQPGLFRNSSFVLVAALLSVGAFLVGFVSLAPFIDQNWMNPITWLNARKWIHSEEAREAFGYLICAVTTAFAIWDSRRRSRATLSRG